jgi:hypothetical protein
MMLFKRWLLTSVLLSSACVTAALAVEQSNVAGRRGSTVRPLLSKPGSASSSSSHKTRKNPLALHGKVPHRSRTTLAVVSPGGGGSSGVKDAEPAGVEGWKQRSASLLGYLVTAGACITKVPQIKRIMVSGSAEGISLTSNYLETISLTNKLIYHKVQERKWQRRRAQPVVKNRLLSPQIVIKLSCI